MPTYSLEKDPAGAARKLSEWATMAARAYGTYAGINTAIGNATDKSSRAVHHANEARREMALMAAVRTFALLDRTARISLQSVYRFLSQPKGLETVTELYASSEPQSPLHVAVLDCGRFCERFLTEYRTIDWDAFGRLQSFRNSALAHIGEDVSKFVRYRELEQIVRICARLAGEFILMTTGLNDWPEEDIDEYQESTSAFWSAVFTADENNLLTY